MSGGFHQVGEGGFKCSVCPDTQYCMACRKLDADSRIADGRAESMVDGSDMDDGTASVSPSALNLALEQEEEMEFLGEPKSEMQHGIA
jgi:hypothetical protein